MIRPRTPLFLAALPVLAVLLAGCGPDHPRPGDGPHHPQTVVTPNGEPLPGGSPEPSCPAVLGAWFDRTDTNRDGTLDLPEYLADAARWFKLADADGNGMITADELTAYRMRITPPRPDDDHPSPRERGGPSRAGSGGYRPQSQPDPVMSADANVDFQVSWAEFEAYARQQFASQDHARQGSLSRTQILDVCSRDERNQR